MTMKRSKLDKIDRNILRNLQDHGRMSNVKLAQEAGISAPPCLRRVRALEDNGYIQGYNATINPSAMGYSVAVFGLVTLKGQSAHDKAEFEKYVDAIEEVRECHLIAGDIDYILKIVAKDWDGYQALLKEHFSNAPHVQSFKSCLSMSASKMLAGIPIEE